MTPRAMDRLVRLEAECTPAATGKHLVFQVEAPRGTPVGEIVAFLRERGHAIHDGDDVLVMNLGAYRLSEGDVVRDTSADLLTEAMRAAAPAAGAWPKGLKTFTFKLDSPRDLH